MGSYWIESTPETNYPTLEGDLETDVAVVGGGITGVTAAYLLKQAGLRVALLEMKRVLRGATGYTTAKVTSGHSLIYETLEKKVGADGARTYAAANQGAIERIRSLVEELGIDCDLETKANFAYTESGASVGRIEAEVAAARRAGLPASLVTETSLPYHVAAAIRIDDQAQFHPRKYLLPIVEGIVGDESYVFEEVRARDVRHGAPCTVETDRGSVHARDVVLATQLPFEDKGLYFAKTQPERSYAVAVPMEAQSAPDGMFISIDSPTRSIRTTPHDGGVMLIVGGEGHKTGEAADTGQAYGRLEAWTRERFGVDDVRYRWSTHDYTSVDRVPFVGPIVRSAPHVWVATGYGKWGMTNGTAAAMILCDLVLGRTNPWASLVSARRLRPLLSRTFVSANAGVAKKFFGDRVGVPGREALERLGQGEGAVVKIEGETLAVSRGEDGSLTAVSPRCAHLGCFVRWNTAERTWDCPCHGSRYLPDGRMIQGPTVADLAAREIPGGAST